MEREPEEDHDGEHGEQCVEALFDLTRVLLDFGLRRRRLGSGRNLGIGQLLLVGQENHQREDQRHDSHAERIVESGVEGVEIALRENAHVCGNPADTHLGSQFAETALGHFGTHRAADILVAEGRKVGIIEESLRAEPPVAHAHGGERCEHRADVDEHVENLETRVAQFGILFVVVKLSHERLEVTFEQAVAEGDHHQGADHHGLRSNAGNHQRGIPHRHHQDTRDDRPLIVAQPVGDQAADERQNVDRGIKKRIDFPGLFAVDTELRHQEQRQNGHHGVEAETFARIGESRGNQTFRLLEHSRIGY